MIEEPGAEVIRLSQQERYKYNCFKDAGRFTIVNKAVRQYFHQDEITKDQMKSIELIKNSPKNFVPAAQILNEMTTFKRRQIGEGNETIRIDITNCKEKAKILIQKSKIYGEYSPNLRKKIQISINQALECFQQILINQNWRRIEIYTYIEQALYVQDTKPRLTKDVIKRLTNAFLTHRAETYFEAEPDAQQQPELREEISRHEQDPQTELIDQLHNAKQHQSEEESSLSNNKSLPGFDSDQPSESNSRLSFSGFEKDSN